MDWKNENPNQGAWFEIPDVLGGGKIKLRVLPPSVARKIRVKSQGPAQVDYYKDPQTEEITRHVSYPTPDVDAEERLTWDYCICGAEDRDGSPVNLTAEWKAKQINENIMFNLFVTRCLHKLNEDQKQFLKDLEKNLPTS